MASAALLAVSLLPLLFASRYLYNCVAGPYDVPLEQLASVANPEELGRYFVRVRGQPVEDSTERSFIESVRNHAPNAAGERRNTEWLAIDIRGRLLLIKTRAGAAAGSGSFHGALQRVDDETRLGFERDFAVQNTRFSNLFLPVMLDATGFRRKLLWFVLLVGPPLGIALTGILKAARRLANWRCSPIYTQLGRFDQAAETSVDQIEKETWQYPANSDLFRTYLSTSFLLWDTAFHLTVMRVRDLVCIDDSRLNSASKEGVIETIRVVDRFGITARCQGGREGINRFIAAVRQRAPWILTGADVAALANKPVRELLELAERRRAQTAGDGPGGTAA